MERIITARDASYTFLGNPVYTGAVIETPEAPARDAVRPRASMTRNERDGHVASFAPAG